MQSAAAKSSSSSELSTFLNEIDTSILTGKE